MIAARLDELHELLYRRGDIRPTNAAIEEITKLVLLRVVHLRDPDWCVDGRPISDILCADAILSTGVEPVKRAFAAAIRRSDVAASLPNGSEQPIWPLDEPLRVSRPDVLAAAVALVADAISEDPTTDGIDLAGTAFDVFLRGRYDHAGGLGTYLTPHTVTENIARLCFEDLRVASGRIWPVVGDPCCGTGRFLVAALNEALKRFGSNVDTHRFVFGADQSASSVAKARVNLLLQGVDKPMVFQVGDSITDPAIDRLGGKLQLVLTNPPFGDGKYDDREGLDRTRNLLPAAGRSRTRIDPALAFLGRSLELLEPGGRLGIVMPDGLVDGPAVQALLRTENFSLLPREVSIEGRISLPTATFALAGTVARTSILFVRRGTSSHNRVFVARADHIGYVKQAGSAVADPNGDDLPVITEVIQNASHTAQPDLATRTYEVLHERPLVAFASADDLSTLEPAHADAEVAKSRTALIRAGATRLGDFLEQAPPKRNRAGRGRSAEMPFLSVLHIDNRGGVDWYSAERYVPSTPGKVATRGSVVVSLLNPAKLRATVVPDMYEFIYCSPEFGVYRAVTGDPYEALVLLYHPHVRSQLAPLGRGTSSSRRRIREQELLDLVVPVADPNELASRSQRARDAHAGYDESVRQLAQAFDNWRDTRMDH